MDSASDLTMESQLRKAIGNGSWSVGSLNCSWFVSRASTYGAILFEESHSSESGSTGTISPKDQKEADEIFGVSDEFTSDMTIGFESSDHLKWATALHAMMFYPICEVFECGIYKDVFKYVISKSMLKKVEIPIDVIQS